MKNKIISQFKESPKTRLGWWSFGLSLGAIMAGPILGVFAAIIRPLIDSLTSESVGAAIGFAFGVIIVITIVVDFVLSILSFRRGERSWAVWVALIFSSIAILMIFVLVVGEVAFQH